MEKLYCTIFIVDVSQNPEEVENVTSRVQQLIEDHGGEIKRHDPWGKRRLAYPIRKRTSGFYVEIEFTANSRLNIPQILESEFRLNDRVLRYLTYVVTREELIQREIDAKRMKAGAPVAAEPAKSAKAVKEVEKPKETKAEKPQPETAAEASDEAAPAEVAEKNPAADEVQESAPAEEVPADSEKTDEDK